MILAGDIGGTKTILSLLTKRHTDGQLTCIKEQIFPSRDFLTFDDILNDFLPNECNIKSACFGIAGPVINQCCQTTNLPWLIDASLLKTKLNTPNVKLLNDLEAMALGMLHLSEDELFELNPTAKNKTGNIAVIAPGTGLGEAMLFWDGEKHHPIATEGGHTDFAPLNTQQDDLLLYLRKFFPDHVSYERILSGVGFSHLFDYVREKNATQPCLLLSEINSSLDRNSTISKLGIEGADESCVEVLRLFVEILGAEAGNLALKTFAVGGVFIGGGIGPKIMTALQNGTFINTFKAKGRFDTLLLNDLSVKLSLNPRTPLIGAINYFS